VGTDGSGNKIFVVPEQKGFFLVVEANKGGSPYDIGTVVFNWDPNDPTVRPDLQVQPSRDLGTGISAGSPAVCDLGPPPTPIGGVPHVGPPPSFAFTQAISNVLNDFGCRFKVHVNTLDACTGDGAGGFFFANSASRAQFCVAIDTSLAFPSGDTLITAQVLDAPLGAPPGTGSPGLPNTIVIRAP